MRSIMRAVARARLVPAALASLFVAWGTAQAQDNTGCTNANGLSAPITHGLAFNLASAAGGFVAGQSVTITFNMATAGSTPFTITRPDGSFIGALPSAAGANNVSLTVAADVSGNIVINSPQASVDGTATIVCLSITGSPPGSSGAVTPWQQNAMNAQAAVTNGRMVLEQSNDAIKLGVLASFAAGNTSRTARVEAASQARIETLAREESDLAQELAELPAATDEKRRRDIARRLSLVRSNLALAREELRPKAERASDEGERKTAEAPRSVRLPTLPAADACTVDCLPTDPTNRRWNGWFDGRLIGMTDSLAPQSVFGFVGIGGVDYKLQPWLTVGFTLGAETFTNKFGLPGSSVAQNGVSAAPYVGIRLDPNVFLSAFVGASHLNYNTVPQPGQTGQFEAWRFMAGGSLIGVWRLGAWRLQPSIDVDYGSESQNGFVDSLGQAVPGQIVQYGRLRGGPEIGYRFDMSDGGWSIEPFALARATFDFASGDTVVLTGMPIGRGRAAGGVGLGVVIVGNGFNIRADMAYDSIGVSGVDLWTGRLRGGWYF